LRRVRALIARSKSPAKQQEIRKLSGFFGGFFAESRPCVFAPDPVSLLAPNGPPIL
jgi:hypothetical protein